ncbi:MAG: hypothetical protein WKF67_11325 [Rubrobacteraceae bacterium]
MRKMMLLAAMLVLLMLSGAPSVLALQDDSMSNDTGISEEIDPDGSNSVNAGSVQYSSEPPPGSYYDCPPDTEPRMLRPCILITP